LKPFTFAGNAGCGTFTLPVPWNPSFLSRFQDLVRQLSAHLAQNPALAAVVVDVKITGLNQSDEETILPSNRARVVPCDAGPACVAGQCSETDALGELEDAGYSDQTATQLLLTLAQTFHDAFPGLPTGSQISGALPSPGTDNLPLLMAQTFVGNATRPITVQDNGLAAVMGVDPGTLFAHDAGVPVGYQALAGVAGDPKCVMGRGLDGGGPVVCDEAVMIKVIDNGIDNGGAQWLELYKHDVFTFPDAGAYAHQRLTGG
jgi:hypothetical protein